MKKTLLLVAHPDLNTSVINKKLLDNLEKSENIIVRDITKNSTNGHFNLEEEHALLKEADRIIFQFPLYWYAYPHILKKWLDDIITPGFAYGRAGDKFGTELIGKHFSVIVTVGGHKKVYDAGGLVGISIDEFMKHLQATIEYVGGVYTYPLYFYGTAFSLTDEQINTMIEDYNKYIKTDYIPKDKQYEKLIKLAYEQKVKGYF